MAGTAGEGAGAVVGVRSWSPKSPLRGLLGSDNATDAGEVGEVITCARSAWPFNAKSCASGMLVRGEGAGVVAGLAVGAPQGDFKPALGGVERAREPASGLAKSSLFSFSVKFSARGRGPF
jgi:hypothetical protein